MQLFAALAVQLVFLVLQVYASPFKRASDNYTALMVNVMLVFTFFSCVVLQQDRLVLLTQDDLSESLRSRFHIPTSSITALLFFSTLFVLISTLLILFSTLVILQHERKQWMIGTIQPPYTQWRTKGSYACVRIDSPNLGLLAS